MVYRSCSSSNAFVSRARGLKFISRTVKLNKVLPKQALFPGRNDAKMGPANCARGSVFSTLMMYPTEAEKCAWTKNTRCLIKIVLRSDIEKESWLLTLTIQNLSALEKVSKFHARIRFKVSTIRMWIDYINQLPNLIELFSSPLNPAKRWSDVFWVQKVKYGIIIIQRILIDVIVITF